MPLHSVWDGPDEEVPLELCDDAFDERKDEVTLELCDATPPELCDDAFDERIEDAKAELSGAPCSGWQSIEQVYIPPALP